MRQKLQRALVERLDRGGEGGAPALELAGTQERRHAARAIDAVERGVAFERAHRLAENAAEPLDIGGKLVSWVAGFLPLI